MQNNKKINYFISIAEFKRINKNPFIAGLLSLFWGVGVYIYTMIRFKCQNYFSNKIYSF